MDRIVNNWKNKATAIFIILIVTSSIFFMKAYLDGRFDSVESLQQYVAGFGILAPVVLTAIQAAQVVLPVLPGFFGCFVGTVMFGWARGFICNYIGISAGSIIAFVLARKYGTSLVEQIFSTEKYRKWAGWAARSRSYSILLLLGMILPLFPDDFFCYFTGLTEMSPKKFVIIIIVGKPWCILAYSLLFSFTGYHI